MAESPMTKRKRSASGWTSRSIVAQAGIFGGWIDGFSRAPHQPDFPRLTNLGMSRDEAWEMQ